MWAINRRQRKSIFLCNKNFVANEDICIRRGFPVEPESPKQICSRDDGGRPEIARIVSFCDNEAAKCRPISASLVKFERSRYF